MMNHIGATRRFACPSGLVVPPFQCPLHPCLRWLDPTGHVDRHTFTASGLLALLALGAFAKVYQSYRALGGDAGYRAQE